MVDHLLHGTNHSIHKCIKYEKSYQASLGNKSLSDKRIKEKMWVEPETFQTLGWLPKFVEVYRFDQEPQDQPLEYFCLGGASLVYLLVGVYTILARIDRCTSLKQGAPWLYNPNR